jgi:hypothetical protein
VREDELVLLYWDGRRSTVGVGDWGWAEVNLKRIPGAAAETASSRSTKWVPSLWYLYIGLKSGDDKELRVMVDGVVRSR